MRYGHSRARFQERGRAAKANLQNQTPLPRWRCMYRYKADSVYAHQTMFADSKDELDQKMAATFGDNPYVIVMKVWDAGEPGSSGKAE